MQITEATVSLHTPRVRPDGGSDENLVAFATIVLDGCFVVQGLKVIRKRDGDLFVSFPSRHLEDRCPRCRGGNRIRDRYCRQCGVPLAADRAVPGPDGKPHFYADVAFPINAECREYLEGCVLERYYDEAQAAAASVQAPSAPLAGRLQHAGKE